MACKVDLDHSFNRDIVDIFQWFETMISAGNIDIVSGGYGIEILQGGKLTNNSGGVITVDAGDGYGICQGTPSEQSRFENDGTINATMVIAGYCDEI